jgi:hypothetical protein
MSDVELSYEREAIGAALRGIAWEQLSLIRPDEMSLDNHRLIWGAVSKLSSEVIPVSATTVADRLGNKLESIGGRGALLELRDAAVITLPSHLAYCAGKIRADALNRRLKAKIEAISLMNGAALPDMRGEIAALAEMAAESVSGGIRNLADIPSLEKLDFTEPCFAVPDVLPYQRVTVLAGQAGSGKTYLMLAMAIACATGGKFLGRECMQMPALILDRENSGGEIRDRIRKMAGGDVPGIRVWGEWVEKEGPPDLADPRLLKWAKLCKPLIIADSLGQFLEGGDEKEITDIAKLFQPAHRLKNMGATIAIIAHVSDKPGAPAYRGHSSIKGNTDLLTILTRDRETELLTLKQEKHRGNPETTITIRADFSTGEFTRTDNPIAEEKRNDTAKIADLIAAQPGISQNKIKEAMGVRLDKVKQILAANTNRLWRTESGDRGATCYYPMSVVPPVPPVPTCSGTTGIG